jgi:hypothetical protein
MPEYTLIIEANPKEPDRYLPPSWKIDAANDADAWRQGLKLCGRERVGLRRVLNDRGQEVFD